MKIKTTRLEFGLVTSSVVDLKLSFIEDLQSGIDNQVCVCVCVHRITIFPAQGIIQKWMNRKLRNKNNDKTYFNK